MCRRYPLTVWSAQCRQRMGDGDGGDRGDSGDGGSGDGGSGDGGSGDGDHGVGGANDDKNAKCDRDRDKWLC